MKLIAFYKAFSGGDLFPASLMSVAPLVDGVVVAFSVGPWMGALDAMRNDCRAPLDAFTKVFPRIPVYSIECACARQEAQYRAGLSAVSEHFGPDVRVLLVDTDEVWRSGALAELREVMFTAATHKRYFSAGIRTYLKSPLYQVWPAEAARVIVGLASPDVPYVAGRFQDVPPAETLDVPVAFHHYPYVRESRESLRLKLLNTSSQESHPSDFTWMERVYDKLPEGVSLHMTVGYEGVWDRVRIVLPPDMPGAMRDAPITTALLAREDREWRERVHDHKPEEAIYPMPSALQATMYGGLALRRFTNQPAELVEILKTTVYEAAMLMYLARSAPAAGDFVEIGSGAGGSMACLLEANTARGRHFTAIDPFGTYDEETHAGVARGVSEGDEVRFWAACTRFGMGAHVENLKEGSETAHAKIQDGSCSLVFVDGNHTYANIAGELRDYWPKVKTGGLLIGHDYTVRFPGVIRAVDEWEHSAEVIVPVGTSLFYVRKT